MSIYSKFFEQMTNVMIIYRPVKLSKKNSLHTKMKIWVPFGRPVKGLFLQVNKQ